MNTTLTTYGRDMTVLLTTDIATARDILKPEIDALRGLLQMWHMFKSAHVVAVEFSENYETLSYQLKIACTRSLVVDYQKPWSGNYSPEINTLKVYTSKKKWSYPFLSPVIKTAEHEALFELRNSIVAHLDQGYEGGGVTLNGITMSNTRQDNNTLDNVFVPTTTVLSGTRGLWWLSDKQNISGLSKHIKSAEKLVGTEIRSRSKAFRLLCIDHMHVIAYLSDLFSVVDTPIVAGKVNVTTHAADPQPLSASTPNVLKIGDQNIQSLGTVYEPSAAYPSGVEIEGKGYRLKIGEILDGSPTDFQVTFPPYPHPKGH